MDHLRDNIDNLTLTQQTLLACVQAPKKATHTRPEHNDLLTPSHHDNITYGFGTAASTWESLHSQYPPKHSEFAPLASAAANGDGYDTAFSQAATMTAYAIELLQDATVSQNDDERSLQQASDLLSKLRDALLGTYNEHRDWRASEQEPEYYGDELVEGTSEHRSERQVGRSGSGPSRRWHPYHRDHSLWATSREKSARPTTPASATTSAASENQNADDAISRGGSSPGDAISREWADDSDVEANVSITTTTNQASMLLPEELGRRQVIRAAFLRQGFTESDITAYFEL
ncbi:hypothetical protein GGI21_005093, partial [Coemansia aciculifera]